MKSMMFSFSMSCLFICLGMDDAGKSPSGAPAEVRLDFLTSGLSERFGARMPQKLTITPTQPSALIKAPAALEAPLYGVVKFGVSDDGKPLETTIIIDEPAEKPGRLFVDFNRNGDLTDDGHSEWVLKTPSTSEARQPAMYQSSVQLQLSEAADAPKAQLNIYRFDKSDARFAHHAGSLFYYRDYARSGKMTISGAPFDVLLIDENTRGDFRSSGVNLVIDVNRNGSFEPRLESFDTGTPFNVLGKVYEVAAMSADGSEFKIADSTKNVPAPGQANNHQVGSKITSFTSKSLDGREVHFPEDFKGKLVLLDFWATWCGPCMKEMPELGKVYEEFRGQGLEILGVSVDSAQAGTKVQTTMVQQKMVWPQVLDAKLGESYQIRSIPMAYLVNGDTGEILALGASLRGQELHTTIANALRSRNQSLPKK